MKYNGEKANKIPCEIIMYPEDKKYTDESIREFQGCPTIAITPNGRIFAAWYSGGNREPHIDNFNLIVKSDDGGKTWSKPIAVIPSSREKFIQALDIQLFTAPDGKLFVYWVEDNAWPEGYLTNEPGPYRVTIDGYVFDDRVHAMWYTVCDDPDADVIKFSEPTYADSGFLRCKPLVLNNGNWLCFNYDQTTNRYGYSISYDNGRTYKRSYGAKKIKTWCDEGMAYQRNTGEVHMLARAEACGKLAETVSYDDGETWNDVAFESNITNPDSRFFISRTPTGRILLVHNDSPDKRINMTVALSEDEGETFPYSVCIDTRFDISYPDCAFYDGKIFLVYDRERTIAREILFASFMEEDIIAGTVPQVTVISKP